MPWPKRTHSGLLELAVIIGVGVGIVSLLVLGNRAAQSWDIQPLPASNAVIRIPLLGPQHRYLFQPASARVTVGAKYRFQLTTQCGLADPVGPDFDGSFWDPDSARQASAGPPPGFDAPADTGYMVLLSPAVAEFHSSHGATARFHRHSGSVIASLCE